MGSFPRGAARALGRKLEALVGLHDGDVDVPTFQRKMSPTPMWTKSKSAASNLD
jgi:hypothetical protein